MGRAVRRGRRSPRKSGLSGLADALFSATRQRVLGLVLGQPDRVFMLSDLIRLADAGSGAVQREIERFDKAGIVTITSAGGRKYVQANKASPIFTELRGIVEKTSGVEAQLRAALAGAGAEIGLAILFGSVAKGGDTAASDIDVLVVSDDLTQEAAFRLFQPTETRLGRRINPTIYTTDEFRRRRQAEQPFLTKMLAGKHVLLVGSSDEL